MESSSTGRLSPRHQPPNPNIRFGVDSHAPCNCREPQCTRSGNLFTCS